MSLVKDDRPDIEGRVQVQRTTQRLWDQTLPDLALEPVASADLLLALAGVLPDGHLLGSPVVDPDGRAQPPADLRSVAVQVGSAAVLDQAVALGGVVLRDEEHTPLAVLRRLTRDPARPHVLSGVPESLRSRESGPCARMSVDFDDTRLHGMPVLFLSRPATANDLAELRVWSREYDSLLVLVPEHGPSGRRVPTSALLQLAVDLAADLDIRNASVFTVPLGEHDEASAASLMTLIARRLGAADMWQITDSLPCSTAPLWARVQHELLHGSTDTEGAAFLAPRTRALLRAWRPPRTERGLALMFTGLSGSGKSTLGRDVADWLADHTARRVTLLDGDVVRRLLSSGLGFDRAARELNVRRIGYVASEVVRHGGIAICSPIAPFAGSRAEVRRMVESTGDFLLVHVSTPLEECERRDLKGLYAKARLGQLKEFTGISSPYEVPQDADLHLDTSLVPREEAAQMVIALVRSGGWLGEET